MLLWWGAEPFSLSLTSNLGAAILLCLLAHWDRNSGRNSSRPWLTVMKDPQFVVIDEVAGQLIALIAVPVAWKSLLLGFILFRGFDILKPPPVRHLERLPEGTGIVLDDVGAGLYALAVMQVVLHFGLLSR